MLLISLDHMVYFDVDIYYELKGKKETITIPERIYDHKFGLFKILEELVFIYYEIRGLLKIRVEGKIFVDFFTPSFSSSPSLPPPSTICFCVLWG